MSVDEDTAHFTLWAAMSFPLMLGHDVRNQSADTLRILTNSEVLDISADLSSPARLVAGNLSSPTQVYLRQLRSGDYAAVLFNRDDSSAMNITLPWSAMAWPSLQPAKVRDLWRHQDIGVFTGDYTARVRPHAVVAIRLSQLPTNGTSDPSMPLACPCDGSEAQRWNVTSVNQLVSQVTHTCLDINDCAPPGTPHNVDLFSCRDPAKARGCGATNQRWTVAANGSIVSFLDWSCLTSVPAAGQCRTLATERCTSQPFQRWSMSADGSVSQGDLCLGF